MVNRPMIFSFVDITFYVLLIDSPFHLLYFDPFNTAILYICIPVFWPCDLDAYFNSSSGLIESGI
jgi:hypothetical protein